jgi:hypothetical protein
MQVSSIRVDKIFIASDIDDARTSNFRVHFHISTAPEDDPDDFLCINVIGQTTYCATEPVQALLYAALDDAVRRVMTLSSLSADDWRSHLKMAGALPYEPGDLQVLNLQF